MIYLRYEICILIYEWKFDGRGWLFKLSRCYQIMYMIRFMIRTFSGVQGRFLVGFFSLLTSCAIYFLSPNFVLTWHLLFYYFFFFDFRQLSTETRRHHEAIVHHNLDGLAVLNNKYGLCQNVCKTIYTIRRRPAHGIFMLSRAIKRCWVERSDIGQTDRRVPKYKWSLPLWRDTDPSVRPTLRTRCKRIVPFRSVPDELLSPWL